MFFVLSKLFWFIAAPTNLLLICGGLGVLCLFLARPRAGQLLVAISLGGLIILAASPLPRILARPLEDRFPQVMDDRTPIRGIVVLGGAIGRTRGLVDLNESGERMTESVRLARLHPDAMLVFAGGSTNMISDVTWTEAEEARRFYLDQGVAADRLILEDQSRNTFENAVNTARLIRPKANERWLLLTSAYHMPRSMGVFRKAGLNLEAYPVDYNTSGRPGDYRRLNTRFSRALVLADDIVKEYIGLLAYRLSDYTDELMPKP
jgi:uncharacterized SAM-binding protein YcdF (DUF218 family)